MTELVHGVLSRCYCGFSAGSWVEHQGAYVCVHDRCLPGLAAVLEELDQAHDAATPQGPRGAYARRTVRATQSTVSRVSTAPLGAGSPFHVPGMVEGAPWTVLTETNLGHLGLPCGRNEAHARSSNRGYRSACEHDMAAAFGGVYAVGGMIITPTGAIEDAWGHVPTIGASRWRAVHRISRWTSCAGCHRQLWPGCLVTVTSQRCVTCTAAEETDDPRIWPDEPGYPGDSALPDHLKKNSKKKR